MDPATAEEVRALLTKGRTGGNLFFTTVTHAKRTTTFWQGVDSPRTNRATYGIDFGLRIRSATTSGLRRWCRGVVGIKTDDP